MVPTIYTLDSAELTVGATTLGIVHAPGYPFYLLVGHLFTSLPVGDVAYRVNLFSAISLALTAPLLYSLLVNLGVDRVFSLAATCVFLWSYYVWTVGIVAEVYAPQICTLAAAGWGLARLYARRPVSPRAALLAGGLFGLAVAMHPVSVLFAPGIVVAFVLMRVPWRACLAAGFAAVLIALLPLVYFPLRSSVEPPLNLAGWYAPDGTFRAVDLRTVRGVWWMLRGEQFKGLFFAAGYIPNHERLWYVLKLFSGNYLGQGILLGLIGLGVLARRRRGVLLTWLILFAPFTYFYLTYGAVDINTMFGPSFLLWALLIAVGLQWTAERIPPRLRVPLAVLIPLIFLGVNYPLVDSSDDTEIRDHSTQLMQVLPPHAAVFGFWWEVVPLQYLQTVEHQRPDVVIYNLFQIDRSRLQRYLDSPLTAPDRPIIFISQPDLSGLDPDRYRVKPLLGSSSADLSGEIAGYRLIDKKTKTPGSAASGH